MVSLALEPVLLQPKQSRLRDGGRQNKVFEGDLSKETPNPEGPGSSSSKECFQEKSPRLSTLSSQEFSGLLFSRISLNPLSTDTVPWMVQSRAVPRSQCLAL